MNHEYNDNYHIIMLGIVNMIIRVGRFGTFFENKLATYAKSGVSNRIKQF